MNDPFLLLPANLAGLARIAAREIGRFVMHAIRVVVPQEGHQAEMPRLTLEVHGPAVPLVITAQSGG